MKSNNNKHDNILEQDFIRDFLQKYPTANLYLVGGAVRDYFLGVDSCDYDFIVEKITEDQLVRFLAKHGKVIAVDGRTFGTIKFMPTGEKIIIDFAIPRREKYEPGKRRKDAHIELGYATLLDDLARRDFTINAMAIDLRCYSSNEVRSSQSAISNNKTSACLFDPFNGLADIKNKLIRAVGNPYERFTEDPTRILRGIRFAVKFGFEIEGKTLKAMRELKEEIIRTFINEKGGEIERVSWEVIGQEFLKTLDADPRRCIEVLDKVGLLKLLLPEIEAEKGVDQPHQFHSEGDVFTHTLLALEKLGKNAPIELKLATLLHDIGKPNTFTPVSITKDRIRFNDHDRIGAEIAKDILGRLRMPNKTIDNVSWLIQNHMRIIFAFPNMRAEKKKNFARNDLVLPLLELVKADTLASIDAQGKTFFDSYQEIADEIKKIRKEALSRPKEIINGDEIIKTILEIEPNFNLQKEGKKIGALKKNINTMYDKEEIKTKAEALERIRKWARKKASKN